MKKTAESKYLQDDASNYDTNAYQKPSVTVDITVCTVINSSLQVLLIKRLYAPYKNQWAIPGGFVNIEHKESLEEAARRKLEEETGIGNVFLEQLKTYGEPQRDPRMRVITVAYYALVPFSSLSNNVTISTKSECIQWFPFENLPNNLAFDHANILYDLLDRLRGKISYTPIAFNLLEKHFTWTELQEIYEIVLGKKLLTPNFRRKLLSMYNIKELSEKKKTKGRPSSLLEFEGEKEF
jgi:8-oxo-dGTP diphosphatase